MNNREVKNSALSVVDVLEYRLGDFVTPEEFGAIAYEDTSVAVNSFNAFKEAIETGKDILIDKKYRVYQPEEYIGLRPKDNQQIICTDRGLIDFSGHKNPIWASGIFELKGRF